MVRTDLFGWACKKALILPLRVVVLPEKGKDSRGLPRRSDGWVLVWPRLAQLVDGETNKTALA